MKERNEPMLSKMKRFIKTTLHLPFILALVLVLTLTTGTALGSTFLGWPNDGTFQLAVDQAGHVRLLSPDIKGEHNDELKKNEFLIELPSRQLVATLADNITQLVNRISGLESTISSLQSIVSGLDSEISGQQNTIGDLESTIGNLESRLSALESGNFSGGGDPSGDPGGGIITDGLVLWLPMDEGQGSVVADQSGLGNNGVITGATWTQLPNGRWYLSFDGTGDFMSLPVSSALTSPTEGTIVVWFKQDTADNGRGLVQASDEDTIGRDEIGLQINARRFLQWRTDIGGGGANQEVRTANGIYELDTWVCVIVTSDGSTIEIDTDGVNRSLTVKGGSNNGNWFGDVPNIDNFTIGSLRRPAPVYFMGDIGEVIIYDSYKSFSERQAIYLATKSKYE